MVRVELLLPRDQKTLQSVNSSLRAIIVNWLSWLLRPHSTVVSARSKPLVTVILFAGPFFPGKLDICDIPDEKTRDFTITLTGKIDQTSLKTDFNQVSKARLSLFLDDRSVLFSANYITP